MREGSSVPQRRNQRCKRHSRASDEKQLKTDRWDRRREDRNHFRVLINAWVLNLDADPGESQRKVS